MSGSWQPSSPATWHDDEVYFHSGRAKRSAPAGPPEVFDPHLPPGEALSVFSVGPWWVLVELGDVGGRLEAVRVEIRAYADADDKTAAPVTAAALRYVPFGKLIDGARHEYAEEAFDLAERLEEARRQRFLDEGDGFPVELETAWRHVETALTTKRKAGRPPLTRSDLDNTVKLYQAAVAAGARDPIVRVAKALSLSRSAVAKRIAQARKAKLLPGTGRGVAKA